MIILGHEPTWQTAKKKMDSSFLGKLITYDHFSTSTKAFKRIQKFTTNDNFKPDIVGELSKAAEILCVWVQTVEAHYKAQADINPKRNMIRLHQDQVSKFELSLKKLDDEYSLIASRLIKLEADYENKKTMLAQ